MILLLKNKNITWKSKQYHIFKGRVTNIILIISLIALIYIGYKLGKPIDWYFDRLVLLLLAFSFRKALKGIE